jgi:hypothetical protein
VTFSINGFSFGTMPLDALTVREGERVPVVFDEFHE